MASKVERTCTNPNCKKLFMARTADVKRGWGMFCSKSCKAKAQEQQTGQYAAYKNKVQRDDEASYLYNEAGLDSIEDGWDGHKNAF